MGVRTLADQYDNHAVMYCSTSGWAFGPVVDAYEADDVYLPASDVIDLFIEWLPEDPRHYSDPRLESEYAKFSKELPQLAKVKAET